ncbi:MAG TPA: hypothetical protein VHO70_15925 [Chitinispirillaceae bacterium]|nr:hypothetical protein [Chitinispirillaceae bacterium]
MLDVHDFWGKRIGTYNSIGECKRGTGLTYQEICKSIETGSGVHGFFVSLSDSYLRRCCIGSMINYHGKFSCDQIAEILGVSTTRVHFLIRKALIKMKERLTYANN